MSSVIISGDVSGTVTLQAPSSAGSTVLTLPSTSGTLSSLASVTNNGVTYVNSTGQPTSGSSFVFDGTNVGIGTNSPESLANYVFAQAGSAGNLQGVFQAYDGTTKTAMYSTAGLGIIATRTAHPLALYTNGSERARIDTNGNFLIGATTSSYGKLEVDINTTANNGAARFINNATSGYVGELVQIISAQGSATTYNLLSVYYSGGAAYAFKVRGDGTLFAQNTTVQSASDARFKENIVNSTQGLDVITALRPVRFDIKESSGVSAKTNQIGFIAQEVKAVFPDAVDVWGESDDPENPYLSLGATALIPVLVKAIQELNAKVDAQAAEIAALKGAA